MLKQIRTIGTCLACLLLVIVLVACEKTPGKPSESGSQPQDLSVHKIVDGGKVQYRIVRPDKMSAQAREASDSLYALLSSFTYAEVEYDTDLSPEYLKLGYHDPEAYEILVGNTNYSESAQVISGLGYGDYAISTVGRKIVVAALTDRGLTDAVNVLNSIFRSAFSAAQGELTVEAEELEKTATFNKMLEDVPMLDGSVFDSGYDCGDGSYMIKLSDVSTAELEQYLTKLRDMNYKEHASTVLAERNRFVTMLTENYILTVIHTDSDKLARIIVDRSSLVSLPEYDKEYNESDKICNSLLIQVGISPSDNEWQIGECYLIRCEDGRFIVYDGGYSGNESGVSPRNNAKNLYNTLVKYTPDGMKPTIAAWIFTHAHGDHSGVITDFAPAYSSYVDVDQFVYNFPSADQFESADTYWGNRTKVADAISKYYKSSDFVKAHPGQRFRYANVELEILYTLELYAPRSLTYFNTSSLVTRLFVNGQSIMMPGDMSTDSNKICREYYGDYLKSDFYQVTHHGYSGGSTEFNKLCAPRWVLWPVGESDYKSLKAESRNSYLSSKEAAVELFFPAFYNTTVIKLPFGGTSDDYEVYPNAS